MKKAEQGQKTRGELLRMGANLFAMHGYHHTSTTEILAAVSISKGAFYHHFASKEDFAQAILSQLQQDYHEQVVEPTEALPPEQRLAAVLEKIVELNGSGQWCNCRLLSRLTQDAEQKESDLSGKVNETIDFLLEFLSGCAADAIKGGVVKNDLDSQAIAQSIIAILFGALTLKSLDASPVDISSLINQFRSLITVPG